MQDIEYEDIVELFEDEEYRSYEDYYEDQDENWSYSPGWSNYHYYTEYWESQ